MQTITNRHEAVAAIKARIVANYPSLWRRLISQWQMDSNEDRGWLIYAANYLFRTQNVRWVIDPFTIYTRLKQTPPMDLAADLQTLDFILLTHKHADHLDLPLIQSLAKYPIRWVIPEFLLPLLVDCNIDPAQILVPKHLEVFHIKGLAITPFDGMHIHITSDGVQRGVPAMGYYVQYADKTWLFPGDTRTHTPEKLPAFPPPDLTFAHLWLGKACADMPVPPKVDDFCRFFLYHQPKRLYITHQHEIGRVPNEFWDARHYNMVEKRLHELKPDLPISRLQIGQSFLL